MNDRTKVIQICKAMGVMLLDCGDCLSVDAPAGQKFRCVGVHSRTIGFGPEEDHTKGEAWSALLDDLEHGLEACEDADCDSCIHEPMDFEAIHKVHGGTRLV
jgi:hypothetical protein